MKNFYIVIRLLLPGLFGLCVIVRAQGGGSIPAVPVDPNPSLSMVLNHAGMDSIVITLHFTNNNVTWPCEGVQAGVEYKPLVLTPNYGKGMIPIHGHRFAQFNWQNYDNYWLDNDGIDPDVMLYAEGPNSGNVSIGANQQFDLCKMSWAIMPLTPPQSVSFAYHANTGANGVTGYLWTNDPDLRAFGSVTGLGNVYFPVELRAFTARQEGGMVVLQWQTASETNNMGFEVQRRQGFASSSLSDWKRIDFVKGRGTTLEPAAYMTIDMEEHPAGIYQYRLRQIDFDGTANYSAVEEVDIRAGAAFELSANYPNPVERSAADAVTRIGYTVPAGVGSAQVDIRLYDALGREVATIASGAATEGYHTVEFNAQGLSAGVYTYILRSGSTQIGRRMLIRD